MCGIAGFVDFKDDVSTKKVILENMTNKLKMRGPDSYGYYVDKNVMLGHRRLIVVDPNGGKQPMIKQVNGHKYIIVYNGELYNTEDIRKELYKKGYSFSSYSDTEVLLTSYIEWGEKCLDKLNGIFAFTVYDDYRKSVLMARDQLGVKPFFYTTIDKTLVFASEIKSLFCYPGVEPILDKESLTQLFAIGPSVNPGSAVFKGINELKPGYYLTYSANSDIKVKKYWDVTAEENTESLNEAIEHTQSLLIDAIKRQLVGDVPLCTFLSGGLDSSVISAIAANEFRSRGNKLTTYSIDYNDNDKYFKSSIFQPTSDEFYAEKLAKDIDTNHKKITLYHENLANSLKEAVISRDLPGMADIDSSLYLFCKEIKKDFIVSLSGECADEIFGGYPWFTRPELINAPTFPWSRFVSDRRKILSKNLKDLKIEDYTDMCYKETLKDVPHLDGEDAYEHRLREISYLNLKWFMITLLIRKDRCSMANSLEVRVPFADKRLVQYAYNLPTSIKFIGGREKGLLRMSCKSILPDYIIDRKKSPYPKTFNPVYTDIVCKTMNDILHNNNSPILQLIDKDVVQNIVDTKGSSYTTPWYGQLMTGAQFIAYLIQINIWLQEYKINIDL